MSEDRPFERLLRGAARRGRQSGPCPDAELLAAYAEDALSRSERAAVERHAADCPLCTEHLGLLASLADPATGASDAGPTPRSALWRGWKWLVPAATVVVVFAVWQRTETTRPPEGEGQSFETRAERPPAPQQDPTSRAPAAPEMTVPAEPGAKRESDSVGSKPTAKAKAGQRDSGAPASTPPPVQAAPSAQPRAPESVPAPLQDEVQEMRKDTAVPNQGDAGTARRSEPEGRQSLAFGAQDVVRVVTAAPDVLVRLSLDGIERSTDAGVHWDTEVAHTPASLRVLACASREVCWAGGDQGLLLLRDASGTWTRRPLPATSAIVAIEATRPQEAVVTLTDGRRFRTTDGGASWNGVRQR